MTQNLNQTYEAMFLVDAAWAASSWDDVLGTINTIMNRAQADVISLRKWDERRLCFDIKGCKRATYILCYFRVLPTVISQMERDVQLNESILRVLILTAEHVSQEQMDAPTPAMLQTHPTPPSTPVPDTKNLPALDDEELDVVVDDDLGEETKIPFDAIDTSADNLDAT